MRMFFFLRDSCSAAGDCGSWSLANARQRGRVLLSTQPFTRTRRSRRLWRRFVNGPLSLSASRVRIVCRCERAGEGLNNILARESSES